MTKKQRKEVLKPRQERRADARAKNKVFKPKYNGKSPITFEEYFENFVKDEDGKTTAPRSVQKSPLLNKPKPKKKKATAKKTAAKKTTPKKKSSSKSEKVVKEAKPKEAKPKKTAAKKTTKKAEAK